MGYTHYWRQHRDFTQCEWGQICEMAVKVIAARTDLAFEDDAPTKPPAIEADIIRFNGIGKDGHETFLLTCAKRAPYRYETADDFKDGAFSFCKTAHKPYDAAVCAVLAIAFHIAPDALDVSSDGEPDEWAPHLQWASLMLDTRIAMPLFSN